MTRYSDEIKKDALETYRKDGIRAAQEKHQLCSTTIYRWAAKEKREAMLALVMQEDNTPDEIEERTQLEGSQGNSLPEERENQATKSQKEQNEGEKSGEEDVHNAPDKRRSSCITCENDQTVPDMIALLEAENEKLRRMNLQLRKALQALVM